MIEKKNSLKTNKEVVWYVMFLASIGWSKDPRVTETRQTLKAQVMKEREILKS